MSHGRQLNVSTTRPEPVAHPDPVPQRRLFERTDEPFMVKNSQATSLPSTSRDAARLRNIMASGRSGATSGSGTPRTPKSPDGNEPRYPQGPDDGEPTALGAPGEIKERIDYSVPSPIESGPIQLDEFAAATVAPIAIETSSQPEIEVAVTAAIESSSSKAGQIDLVADSRKEAVPQNVVTPVEQLAPAKRVAKEPAQYRQSRGAESNQQGSHKRFDPPVSEPADEAPRMVIQPEISYTPKAITAVRRWNRIPVLICTVVGIMIAVGLYAGGGDILGTIFSNQNEGITPVNPAAITERPRTVAEASVPQNVVSQSDNSAPQPQIMNSTAGVGGMVPEGTVPAGQSQIVAEVNRNAAAEPRDQFNSASVGDDNDASPTGVQRSAPAQALPPAVPTRSVKPVEKVPTEKLVKEARETATKQPVAEKRAKNLDEVATPKVKVKEEPANSTYNIQVRATTDQSEANLIARRLKRKGFVNVTIVQTEKNGEPFFKVRFGSYSSKEEAKQAANGSGYSGTWVMKQK